MDGPGRPLHAPRSIAFANYLVMMAQTGAEREGVQPSLGWRAAVGNWQEPVSFVLSGCAVQIRRTGSMYIILYGAREYTYGVRHDEANLA